MIDDVAVQHPVTWVIGNEGALDDILRCDQHRVAPLPVREANSPITMSCARTEAAKANSAQIKKTTVELRRDFITSSSFTPSVARAQFPPASKAKKLAYPSCKIP